METLNKPDFVAVFVNTNQKPRSIKNQGVYKVVKTNPFSEPKVYGLFEMGYPHPDHEEATITVLEWVMVPVKSHSIPIFELNELSMKALESFIIK